MLATKSEIRDVRRNQYQPFIVLVYKDTLLSANDIKSLPSVISHLLQNYKDVFQRKPLLDCHHCEALNIKWISLQGLHAQSSTRPHQPGRNKRNLGASTSTFR
jgi:hypothetical protein